ncbi:winged helix-turn-helix domain-containing protein [Halobellus sp. Atlit-38R]|jgi:DNA-binding Lrp family transcriptional regulator|uniref:winged helix-turn-helix domain-containing protein n=1 Tax=Halobellus sp. Atlit-38R TaxID=2282131 RepID=UPI000EF1B81B|nr:winged helix-turn-helix domain-containing protein [Halobellus sp. Atlit-38R]RLM89266.1 winged helix-turn-helix domain-containing protein [Halobellus sp. Atlit-38R]
MSDSRPAWDFKERDVVILRELARDPQLSARELTDVLEEEHGIDVSHVTVSKAIRNMREAGVFREAIIPNESYFTFALMEFKFNPENFKEHWRDTMEHIRSSQYSIFYFLSDGEYQWKSVMMFPSQEAESKWLHEFYKEHGQAVSNVRSSTMTNVLKFGTTPGLFDHLESNGGE